MIARVHAIASRECGSFFRLPAGWIVLSLFALLCGTLFTLQTLVPGNPATMRGFFTLSGWLLIPVVPAISMRLFSEEYRSGTFEALATSPVGDLSLVLGKFLGAFLFLLIMGLPSVVLSLVLFKASDPKPEIGPILTGYLSLVLLGSFYLAIGLFISSLTANQTLAFLATLFVLIAFLAGPAVAVHNGPAWIRPIADLLSLDIRTRDFAKGVVDTRHLIFFISSIALLITLAFASVHSRRWRG